MYFKQFYLGCLAHASYLLGDAGEAAVIDPQRDVDQYIEEAARHGFTIRYILETHLHADFVSGHQELARRTGAEIVYGARAGAEFSHHAVHDGDELRVGGVVMRAIETPGHTPESISWLIMDSAGDSTVRVLTGDTLFIGDVGRPDLVGSKGFTPQQMASMLYDSLHTKLMTLADAVEVYPAHGAGSACGRNISKERSSTIGEQRRFNYALRPMPREEFVQLMTADLASPPKYFPMDAEINRRGARSLDELPLTALSPSQVKECVASGALILDVRDSARFASGHIPGSINIGLEGQYASWAGSLLSPDASLVIVAESVERAAEARLRLARVGLENVVGFLDGGLASWDEASLPVVTVLQIDVEELHARISEGTQLRVLDVRNATEFASGHVPGAQNAPLVELEARLREVPREMPIAVICAGGYRSSTAASLLRRNGIEGLFNVVGGTSAWVTAGYETQK